MQTVLQRTTPATASIEASRTAAEGLFSFGAKLRSIWAGRFGRWRISGHGHEIACERSRLLIRVKRSYKTRYKTRSADSIFCNNYNYLWV